MPPSVQPTATSVAGALTSFAQNTTLALTNVTFNLSINRREAPVEYRPIGEVLTITRRQSAESGSQHGLANKLAALFEHGLPSVKSLLAAYGLRASEIAEASHKDLSSRSTLGPLYHHAGIDGTSVWAAATTSECAIAVHLLACMLARQFRAEEAIAAWEGLVEKRQEMLRTMAESSALGLDDIVTSRLEITHTELQAWDASARAWLATADRIQNPKYTQLQLILGNIRASVDSDILKSWHNALTAVDSLIAGAGVHIISSGETLLALASWHLFPDLTILGSPLKRVLFQDPLVAIGGHLTLGAQMESEEDSSGIFWSLPLEHLRHYGEAKIVHRSMRVDNSCVTIPQFQVVILGLAAWFWTPIGADVEEIAAFFISLNKYLEKRTRSTARVHNQEMHTWPGFLAMTAKRVLDSEADGRTSLRRLLLIGQRRAVLYASDKHRSLFNGPAPQMIQQKSDAPTTQTLLPLLKDTESKVKVLRDICNKHLHEHRDELLLRVCDGSRSKFLRLGAEDQWLYPKVNPYNSYILTSGDFKPAPERFGTAQDGWYQNADSADAAFYSVFADGQDHDPPEVRAHRFIYYDPPWRRQPWIHNEYFVYQYVLGDKQVGLFSRAQWKLVLPPRFYDLHDLTNAFDAEFIDDTKLIPLFDEHAQLLRALGACARLFTNFENSNILLDNVLNSPVTQTKWAQSLVVISTPARGPPDLAPHLCIAELNRPQAFACICAMTANNLDLDPRQFDRVIGVSVKDSIYVMQSLLSDPSIDCADQITHVPGNVGRAGTALLEPPFRSRTALTRTTDVDVANFAPFDGRREDHYGSCTTHLWFTGFQRPVTENISGEKFTPCFYLQSVLTVFDGSYRIGDFDAMVGLSSITRFRPPGTRHCDKIEQAPKCRLTSLDNWHEFMYQHQTAVVVRSHGNWLASHDVVEYAASLATDGSVVSKVAADAVVELLPFVFILRGFGERL